MKILLDLQGLQGDSSVRGIGRYSNSFAKAILRQGEEHDISIMLNHAFEQTIDPVYKYFSDVIAAEKIHLWQSLMPSDVISPDNLWRIKTSELLREQFIQKFSPDVLHISSLFEGMYDNSITSIGKFDQLTPVSLTHYDLIPYLNEKEYLSNKTIKKWYFDKLESLKRAKLVLAISEASRQELLTHLNMPEDNVVTVLTDADPRFKVKIITETEKSSCLKQFGISKKFLMYTGVIAQGDSRKNIAGLVHAFALLPEKLRKHYQLVLVGGASVESRILLMKQAKKVGLILDDIIFTHYVTDDELVTLYNLCHLFVFPSLHEGFGLPVLEAMRCGAPVIASDASSIPEVVGWSDALFNPYSDQSMADKIYQALNDDGFYERLLKHSQQQSRLFSWDKTARIALDAFAALHKKTASCAVAGADISMLKEIQQMQDASYPPSAPDLARTALAMTENQLIEHQSKQMFVDVTQLIQYNLKSGIQRVVKNVLQALRLSPPEGYQIFPVFRNSGQYYHLHNSDLNDSNIRFEAIDVSPQDIFLGLDLDFAEDEPAALLLNHHRQRGMKLYFVVYDMLPVLNPQSFTPGLQLAFRNWFDSICAMSDGLISISRSVADEILGYLEQHPAQRVLPLNIGYFHLGADIPENQFNTDDVLEITSLPIKKEVTIFLMVGTIEPRKCHEQILDAMEIIWQQGQQTQLIIFGKAGWQMKSFIARLEKHVEKNKRLLWIKNGSDALLKQLYEHSSALIMASEAEGFGLPIIEAAQYHLPIICRDIPVFKEVARESAFYFSATKGKYIASDLLEWQRLFKAHSYPDSSNLSTISWKESKTQLLQSIIQQDWYAQYNSDIKM